MNPEKPELRRNAMSCKPKHRSSADRSWIGGVLRSGRFLQMATVLVLVVTSAGCYTPVGTEEKRDRYREASAKKKATRDAFAKNAASENTSQTGPVSRLSINAENLEAADLWTGYKLQLAQQAASLSPSDYQLFVARLAADLVRESVSEVLLFQKAKLRITPEMEKKLEEYVNEDISRIVNNEFGGIQRRYEKDLIQKGATLAGTWEKRRREVVIRAYLDQEVKPKLAEPTRDELYDAYQQIAAQADKPQRRKMSLIDVRFRNQSPAGIANPTDGQRKEAARTIIDAARSKLKNGVAFSAVAKDVSNGLNAVDGGAWGWIAQGSMRERYVPAVDALYQMDAGTVSEVIETKDAYFLVRCDAIESHDVPDFESLQPELVQRHLEMTYTRAVSELVEELRSKARIDPPDLGRFHAGVMDAAPAYHELAPPSEVP